NIVIGLSSTEVAMWREAYLVDHHFRDVIESLQVPKSHITPKYPQYQYDDNGLLFFEDSNGNNRLCVPESLRTSVMDQVHNSLMESAHSG
ncbi:hypothetical protein IW262DRAFT_1235578, partial [Armillaria fumosa]